MIKPIAFRGSSVIIDCQHYLLCDQTVCWWPGIKSEYHMKLSVSRFFVNLAAGELRHIKIEEADDPNVDVGLVIRLDSGQFQEYLLVYDGNIQRVSISETAVAYRIAYEVLDEVPHYEELLQELGELESEQSINLPVFLHMEGVDNESCLSI